MSQLVILHKDGLYAAIGRVDIENAGLNEVEGLVASFDPRMGTRRDGFNTRGEANAEYQKAVNKSKERGWKEIFRGSALNHPVYS
jgi:hypothetical protein